jgi:hypothetical protein
MAVVVALLFTLGLTINFFRRELFGIVPGYAPHNFGFNAFFFIPLTSFYCCRPCSSFSEQPLCGQILQLKN